MLFRYGNFESGLFSCQLVFFEWQVSSVGVTCFTRYSYYPNVIFFKYFFLNPKGSISALYIGVAEKREDKINEALGKYHECETLDFVGYCNIRRSDLLFLEVRSWVEKLFVHQLQKLEEVKIYFQCHSPTSLQHYLLCIGLYDFYFMKNNSDNEQKIQQS